MTTKSETLQIRLTTAQKRTLKGRAKAAGASVSQYVLMLCIPLAGQRWQELLDELEQSASDGEHRYALAEIHDYLVALTRAEFASEVEAAPAQSLSPYLRNYVAAMVEQAAYLKEANPPRWVAEVEALHAPAFVVALQSLRAHLLKSSPVPFRRRNIFIDAGIGSRI